MCVNCKREIRLVDFAVGSVLYISRASRPQDLTRPFFHAIFKFRVTHGLSERGTTRSLCFVLQDSKTTYNWAILPFSGTNMCLKHQFLSKYSIIFPKVAGCFVPRGVDRKYITGAIFVYLASWVLKTAPRARLEPSLRAP